MPAVPVAQRATSSATRCTSSRKPGSVAGGSGNACWFRTCAALTSWSRTVTPPVASAQLDAERRTERPIDAVVDAARGCARLPVPGGASATVDHLEAVAEVEVAADDGADGIEPGARQHHQAGPHTRLVFHAHPDAFLDLAGVLSGGPGGTGRSEWRQHGERGHAGEQSGHREIGLK